VIGLGQSNKIFVMESPALPGVMFPFHFFEFYLSHSQTLNN